MVDLTRVYGTGDVCSYNEGEMVGFGGTSGKG